MEKTIKQKAYLFDLDGTLVDSMTDGWVKMLYGYLDDRSISYPPDLVKNVIALGFVGIAAYYKQHFPLREREEEIVASFVSSLKHRYEKDIAAKTGAIEALRCLKERGASLNVLTASPHFFLDPCLKRLGIWDLFDNLWSLEDFPTTKADPAIYRMAADRLGVSCADCVMVDDSVAVLKPAKLAGLQTVGVYDDFSKEYEGEMRVIADRYVYFLTELL